MQLRRKHWVRSYVRVRFRRPEHVRGHTHSGRTDAFFPFHFRSAKCGSSAFNADNATRTSSAWLWVSVPANAFLR